MDELLATALNELNDVGITLKSIIEKLETGRCEVQELKSLKDRSKITCQADSTVEQLPPQIFAADSQDATEEHFLAQTLATDGQPTSPLQAFVAVRESDAMPEGIASLGSDEEHHREDEQQSFAQHAPSEDQHLPQTFVIDRQSALPSNQSDATWESGIRVEGTDSADNFENLGSSKSPARRASAEYFEGPKSAQTPTYITSGSGIALEHVGSLERLHTRFTTWASAESRWRACYVRPSSRRRIMFDLLGVPLIMYDTITIPLEVFAMSHRGTALAVGLTMKIANIMYWSAYLCLNLFIAHYDANGVLVTNGLKNGWRYIRRWGMFDALILCFDYTTFFWYTAVHRANPFIYSAYVVRLLRVFRLMKQLEVLYWIVSKNVHALALDILQSFLFVFLFCHLVGCAWYALGRYDPLGFGMTWTDEFTQSRIDILLHEKDNAWQFMYAISFAWSLTNFALMSTGIYPTNTFEWEFSIAVGSSGVIVFTVLLARVVTSFTKNSMEHGDSLRKMSLLREYIDSKQVDVKTRAAVLSCVGQREKVSSLQECDVELVSSLPAMILSRLRYQIYRLMFEHPLLAWVKSSKFELCLDLCNQAFKEVFCAKASDLFIEMSPATHMYFVTHGELEYTQQFNFNPSTRAYTTIRRCKVMRVHSDGSDKRQAAIHTANKRTNFASWEFGTLDDAFAIHPTSFRFCCEASLWLRWLHLGRMKATRESQLFGLDALEFTKMVAETIPFKFYGDRFKSYIAERPYQCSDVMISQSTFEDLAALVKFAEEDAKNPSERRRSYTSSLTRESKFMITSRFNTEAMKQNCKELKQALKDLGFTRILLVDAVAGERFGPMTMRYLTECDAMIGLITHDYAEKTSSPYCSYYELKHYAENRVGCGTSQIEKFFPIKLCETWPPPSKGAEGAALCSLVFTQDLVYTIDMHNRPFDAKAVAMEISKNVKRQYDI